MPYANSETSKAYQAKYQKEWIKTHRSDAVLYTFKWRRKNPENNLLNIARTRAKKQGSKCDLELSDIKIPLSCPVLGIVLAVDKTNEEYLRVGIGRNGGGAPRPNAPSLDRIDPRRGYVKGNVRVISWRANNLKRDGTLEEMRLVLADLERLQDR
jgi:hypothetical protein